MAKLSYSDCYKVIFDAGLYRQWIQENYNSLDHFKLKSHIKKLSKITKIAVVEVEKDIRESVGLKGNYMFKKS